MSIRASPQSALRQKEGHRTEIEDIGSHSSLQKSLMIRKLL